MSPPAGLARSLLAYALIWSLFAAVPAARRVVSAQGRRLRAALARRFWLGLACGCVLVVLNAALSIRLGTHVLAGTWDPAPGGLILALVWASTVAVTEEMIVRGLLLTRLRQLAGDRAAIALTAVVFAVMHVGRSDFAISTGAQYLADGLLLGWLAVRTGDIWAGTGFHFAKNFGVALAFGGSKHLVPPLLSAAPGGHQGKSDLADLGAYVVTIALCVALFRNTRALPSAPDPAKRT